MGKLCTSVSNFRLSNFFENYLLLHENQFGFRKEYSTIDSNFALHFIIELLRLKRKKPFLPLNHLNTMKKGQGTNFLPVVHQHYKGKILKTRDFTLLYIFTIGKSKVVIFSKGGMSKNIVFITLF
jgi:hypothetical protein